MMHHIKVTVGQMHWPASTCVPDPVFAALRPVYEEYAKVNNHSLHSSAFAKFLSSVDYFQNYFFFFSEIQLDSRTD